MIELMDWQSGKVITTAFTRAGDTVKMPVPFKDYAVWTFSTSIVHTTDVISQVLRILKSDLVVALLLSGQSLTVKKVITRSYQSLSA